MKKIFLLVFVLFMNGIKSQTPYRIDTSYTVKNTYTKLIKKYPFITIAQVKENESINLIYNLVYDKEKTRALHLMLLLIKIKN